MKKYCVHCFETEEIIHYIEQNAQRFSFFMPKR